MDDDNHTIDAESTSFRPAARNNILNEQQQQGTQTVPNLMQNRATTSTHAQRSVDSDSRQCWVCFATEGVDDTTTTNGMKQLWVHPCKCKGSTKWVHERCLQRWIDEIQKGEVHTPVQCAQCSTPYKLLYPSVNALLALLTRLDEATSRTMPILAAGIIALGTYWTFVTHGAVSVLQVYGVHRGTRMLSRIHPLLLFTCLPSIPLTLCTLHALNWRIHLTHRLYRMMNQKEFADGTDTMRIVVPVQNGRTWSSIRRMMVALFMPTIGVHLGRACFANVKQPFTRALCGAGLFYALHTLASIYYRYNQISRGQKRRILDNNDTEQQQQNSNTEHDEKYSDDEDDTQEENGNGEDVDGEMRQMYDGELTPV